MNTSLICIPILPLVGFLINALLGNKLSKGISGTLATLFVLVPFGLALQLFFAIDETFEPITLNLIDWIEFADFKLPIALYLDQLSIMFTLVITGVGSLIHLYSMGYMHDDAGHNRFFMYLNLFVFFMLMLVLGSNFAVTFIGWEGVGLCSYLLIGFWYTNPDYNDAAKKAFVMNRIGDLGYLLAMFLLFRHFNTLEYTSIFQAADKFSLNDGVIVAITALLFVGATGKSAQVPLFTWLPDAMAGPTPVSALIHAATMVTAGIYLLVRSNVLFSLAPITLEWVTIIGFATALYGAIVGLKQMDIKKVLAYSTVSQLGFMFIALGLGAYTTAFFHVLTHAFFKALLFLSAGSVIHAVSGEQDMRKMGGLWKHIPFTGWMYLIGSLAISGIPVFAGFFSKDEILANAFSRNPMLWGGLAMVSALTAFYMFRSFFLTFFGSYRGELKAEAIHESPLTMTIPLAVLAILSIVGGFIGVPEVLGGHHWLASFLKPIYPDTDLISELHLSHSTELALMTITVVLALISIVIAYITYVKRQNVPSLRDEQFDGLTKTLYNKLYIDELYQAIVVKPVMFLSDKLHAIAEIRIIDGLVNLMGTAAVQGSRVLRLAQTGNIGFYLFAITFGLIIIILINTTL
ncbi:MAG TPA: NADH-quinone oxidoreductase subunit L [Luteibaculaceae bacterium]|nr:NADH-quinone oxidoreductase subunit L [Luteibaculaceae bacterium]